MPTRVRFGMVGKELRGVPLYLLVMGKYMYQSVFPSQTLTSVLRVSRVVRTQTVSTPTAVSPVSVSSGTLVMAPTALVSQPMI